jgi:tetratricopeptide repeat protein
MKKLGWMAVVAALLLAGFARGADKKAKQPFYRPYLVAGNPLDDKILEQEKRVQDNPKSAELRNDFGNLLAARRFPKEAREQYEIAMKLDRHYFLAPYNLGLLYESQGEDGKAIRAYEKSVDRNRGFPPARFRLGRLLEKRGSTSRAIAEYARALQIDPEMRDPRRNPLVVDTRLLDRVSLENYSKDMARASETMYAEAARFRKLPVNRALSSEDLEPAGTPPAAPTPVRVLPPSAPPSARQPVAPPGMVRPFQPPPQPTPEVVEQPPQAPEPAAAVPTLPTPDASGRPAYVGGPYRPAPLPTPTPQ